MAYNESEVKMLKEFARETVEKEYTSLVKDLKAKLKDTLEQEKDLDNRIKALEKEWNNYKDCHECMKLNIEVKSIPTQTTEPFDTSMIKRPRICQETISHMYREGNSEDSGVQFTKSATNEPEIITIDSD